MQQEGYTMKNLILPCLAALFALLLATRPAAAGHANGTIVQVAGNERLYYIINGYAAHIPSPRIMQCLQLTDILTVIDAVLFTAECFPECLILFNDLTYMK